MIPRQVLLPSTLLVLACGAARAEAQTIPSPYRFIDHRHEGGVFVATVPGNAGALELGPRGGLLVGARYGIEAAGAFALEGTASLLPTDRRIRVPGEEEGTIEDLGRADVLVGTLDARMRFTLTGDRTWRDLAPFLLMGGGVAVDFARNAEEERELPSEVRFRFGPSFLGVLGAGTRWLPGERLTFRGDVVLHIWKLGTPQAFLDRRDLERTPQQEWTSVPSFSLGLSYRF